MGDPCEPVLMMLRKAGEAVPPLAGQLAAKGYGIVDAVRMALDPVPAAIDRERVVDLALLSAGLSVSPDLPDNRRAPAGPGPACRWSAFQRPPPFPACPPCPGI